MPFFIVKSLKNGGITLASYDNSELAIKYDGTSNMDQRSRHTSWLRNNFSYDLGYLEEKN